MWLGGFALIAGLMIAGVYKMIKTNKITVINLIVAGVLALFFALGVNFPVTGGVVMWVLENVTLMNGFRDTQKFSATACISVCLFCSTGA